MIETIFTIAILDFLVIFYYLIIQPKQHEKLSKGGRQATKEEIETLFEQFENAADLRQIACKYHASDN